MLTKQLSKNYNHEEENEQQQLANIPK